MFLIIMEVPYFEILTLREVIRIVASHTYEQRLCAFPRSPQEWVRLNVLFQVNLAPCMLQDWVLFWGMSFLLPSLCISR